MVKIVILPKEHRGRVVYAENELSEFTRRVPTFRTPKQERYDSDVAKHLIRIWDEEGDGDKMISYFFKKCARLSNPEYWELLRNVWIAAGSTETADRFRRLMKSNRPARGWFMTVEDAETLKAMPDEFTIYRACAPHYNLYEDDILLDTFDIPEEQIDNGDIEDPGISWTLNPVWCRQYAIAKHRIVKAKHVKKEDVFAYVSRRGEEEILLL